MAALACHIGLVSDAGTPLFTAEEMDRVIELAEEEGVASRGDPTQAARASMKYGDGAQVAIGTKIELMPRVNTWFGSACEKVLFPHMASLFPSLISDGSQLRAHTIAVLKYNSTHPRTDVHVDPSLFAFTIALSKVLTLTLTLNPSPSPSPNPNPDPSPSPSPRPATTAEGAPTSSTSTRWSTWSRVT